MSRSYEQPLKYSKVKRAYRWYLKYYAMPHLVIIGMAVLPIPLSLLWDANFLVYIWLFGLFLVFVDGLDNCFCP